MGIKPALVILVFFGINVHASMNETCVKAISPIAKRMKDIIYKSDGNDIVFTYTPAQKGFFYSIDYVHFISLSPPYKPISNSFIIGGDLEINKPFLTELNVENKGKFMISFPKNKKYKHVIREQSLIEQWFFIKLKPFFYKKNVSSSDTIFTNVTSSTAYSNFFYRLSQHDEINLSKNEKVNIVRCLSQFTDTSNKKHAVKIKELLKLE